MKEKNKMIIKLRHALSLIDRCYSFGDIMPEKDKHKLHKDLISVMDFLHDKYIIPKEELTIETVVDNHYHVGSIETVSVKYTLHAGQRRFIKNPDNVITHESFLNYTKKEFISELDDKYKI